MTPIDHDREFGRYGSSLSEARIAALAAEAVAGCDPDRLVPRRRPLPYPAGAGNRVLSTDKPLRFVCGGFNCPCNDFLPCPDPGCVHADPGPSPEVTGAEQCQAEAAKLARLHRRLKHSLQLNIWRNWAVYFRRHGQPEKAMVYERMIKTLSRWGTVNG